MNSPIEPSITRLAPNRSPNQPDAGIATARATRYAVTTPLTDATGTAKSRLSVGSATPTTVASMMFMNIAATYTTLTTNFGGIATFTDYYKIAPVRRVPPGATGAARGRPGARPEPPRSRSVPAAPSLAPGARGTARAAAAKDCAWFDLDPAPVQS